MDVTADPQFLFSFGWPKGCECGQGFISKNRLHEHLRTSHGAPPKAEPDGVMQVSPQNAARVFQVANDSKVVRAFLNSKNGLSEVYSPPRVAEEAKAAGLVAGFSLDPTERREGKAMGL